MSHKRRMSKLSKSEATQCEEVFSLFDKGF
jgi:hypothetical protein